MVKFGEYLEQPPKPCKQRFLEHLCHLATVKDHFGKLSKWKMGCEVLHMNRNLL